jgi:NAD(P)-dependent dehydrogenase (short-subunit alcohol dehydrogenase family)
MGMIAAYRALAGRNAVVVGGAYGVGRAVTLALAGAGVNIATCDADAAAVKAIVAEVEALGVRIVAVAADVCDAAALDGFFDIVEHEFDHLDILVNVAGGVKRNRLLDTSRARNAAEIRLNYGYVIDSLRRCVPLIRKSGRGGAIVNFTTIEGHRGAATYAVYAGAKAATTNFSRAMAVELGAERIRVNLLAPDTTPSRNNMTSVAPEDMAKFADLGAGTAAKGLAMYIPQGEPPTLDDLADATLFLVSDMSRAITGVTLHVDGGTMAASGFLDWPYGDGFSPAPLAGTMKPLFDE